MKGALLHLLWGLTVLLLVCFASYVDDCGKGGGTLARTPHGVECIPLNR